MTAKKYNKLFETFVGPDANSKDNIDGIIAYGQYKIEKREYIIELKSLKGREPTQEELDDYERSWTLPRIENTKESARRLLGDFAINLINQEKAAFTEKLTKDAINDTIKNAVKGSIWKDMGVNILANFAYTVILFVIAIAVYMSGWDLYEALQTFRKE